MKTETHYEISGDEFVAAQTRKIEREFKCSRPKPRTRQMGFKGTDKSRRQVQVGTNIWKMSELEKRK